MAYHQAQRPTEGAVLAVMELPVNDEVRDGHDPVLAQVALGVPVGDLVEHLLKMRVQDLGAPAGEALRAVVNANALIDIAARERRPLEVADMVLALGARGEHSLASYVLDVSAASRATADLARIAVYLPHRAADPGAGPLARVSLRSSFLQAVICRRLPCDVADVLYHLQAAGQPDLAGIVITELAESGRVQDVLHSVLRLRGRGRDDLASRLCLATAAQLEPAEVAEFASCLRAQADVAGAERVLMADQEPDRSGTGPGNTDGQPDQSPALPPIRRLPGLADCLSISGAEISCLLKPVIDAVHLRDNADDAAALIDLLVTLQETSGRHHLGRRREPWARADCVPGIITRVVRSGDPTRLQGLVLGLIQRQQYEKCGKTVQNAAAAELRPDALVMLAAMPTEPPELLGIICQALCNRKCMPAAEIPPVILALNRAGAGDDRLAALLSYTGYKRATDYHDISKALEQAGLPGEAEQVRSGAWSVARKVARPIFMVQ